MHPTSFSAMVEVLSNDLLEVSIGEELYRSVMAREGRKGELAEKRREAFDLEKRKRVRTERG